MPSRLSCDRAKNFISIKDFRSHFPIFSQSVNGYPFIYFDSASTAQVPTEVAEAMSDYYLSYKANIGRGIYTFAEKATAEYEVARQTVARFIGANPKEILFTSGATESINLVAISWAQKNLKAGDEIIISAVEHHSNFLPWQELSRHLGLIFNVAPMGSDGIVDMQEFQKLVSKKTKLIAMIHSSNVVGATSDIKKIVEYARPFGAVVLVDASQSIAHQKIDVKDLGFDFLVFSGHKLFGPTGTGVLYVKPDRVAEMYPSTFGGGMVFSVGQEVSQYRPFPQGFEAGTPNVAGIIGLKKAIEFVERNIDFEQAAEHETSLAASLILGLEKLPNVKIISFKPSALSHVHMVTFVSEKYHAHDIAAYLDRYGIAVRAGHHCVQMFHESCNVNASVRISFAAYNTQAEVDFCLQKLSELLS